MRVVASANQKGGCGKTTTAINLSYSLSLKEKRVLLIDFDPQAHATMGLNINPSDLEKSIYDVITPQKNWALGLGDILIDIKDNFDLVPSSLILTAIEQELSGIEGREDMLFEAIQELVGVIELALPFDERPNPSEISYVLFFDGSALFVSPVSGDTFLGDLMHFRSADLDLERYPRLGDHARV